MNIEIIYQSGYEHKQVNADHIPKGPLTELETVELPSATSARHSVLWASTRVLPDFLNDKEPGESNNLVTCQDLR